MNDEKNIDKSSQDYKKSQYGSWYKKSAENKKEDLEKRDISIFQKIINFFKKYYNFFIILY